MHPLVAMVILLQTAVVLLLFILFLFTQRKLSEYEAMHPSLEDVEQKETIRKFNERDHFRLEMLDKSCEIHFLDFENKQLDRLKFKTFDAILANISLGGVMFVCPYDLPINKDILIEIRFSIKGEYFALKAEILRKEVLNGTENNFIRYGSQFVDLYSAEKERLHNVLNQLLLERREPTA
ncbi:PilZ domain-containing protein [Radiobacillus deserti]|uniref:PilZ domain-containing protein n=1 Tax=Radiobacillus deserti TaxID=2594883 RepID=A0A516KDN6_9BACI|nr:PilZ domain-containing protein [Radiobacillus deserti]QDP39426.1 PilZ domain-containing protein [Radiobacillus deserti]